VNPALDKVARDVISTGMRRGPLRHGYESPTALRDVAGRVVVVLPAEWKWAGRLAQETDLAAIEGALQAAVRGRSELNRQYVVDVPIGVRRARPGEPAWTAREPVVVREEEVAASAPRSPVRVGARVRVGRSIHPFGEGHDRESIVLGPGELVLGLLDGAVFLTPKRLLVEAGGACSSETVQLTSGSFQVYALARSWPGAAWFRGPKIGGRVAEGEILELVGAQRPVAAPDTLEQCHISGDGVDIELHAGHLTESVKHANSVLDVRIEPARGVVALRGYGAGPVTGTGSHGRILLDRFVDLEALPGEVTSVDVAGKLLRLTSPGSASPRSRRRVTMAPASHAGSIDGIHTVSPQARGVVHIGEVLLADFVRPIFRALVACRVDGRLAAVGDLLPVRESFSISFGSSSLSVSV